MKTMTIMAACDYHLPVPSFPRFLGKSAELTWEFFFHRTTRSLGNEQLLGMQWR